MVVRHYLTPKGVDPFQAWLDGLKDLKARIAILRRIRSIARDNFGDPKFINDGVWELRVDAGPGYRVYYGRTRRLSCCAPDRSEVRRRISGRPPSIGLNTDGGYYDFKRETCQAFPES